MGSFVNVEVTDDEIGFRVENGKDVTININTKDSFNGVSIWFTQEGWTTFARVVHAVEQKLEGKINADSISGETGIAREAIGGG